jgi:hypothetical protein
MSTTAITLTSEQGAVSPSLTSVLVNNGDTVTFATGDGSTAFLFFSPAAAGILSPTPASPVAVSSTPVSFSFTASGAGVYGVYLETAADVSVPEFSGAPSNTLAILTDLSNVTFGVLDTPIKTGVTPPPTSDS